MRSFTPFIMSFLMWITIFFRLNPWHGQGCLGYACFLLCLVWWFLKASLHGHIIDFDRFWESVFFVSVCVWGLFRINKLLLNPSSRQARESFLFIYFFFERLISEGNLRYFSCELIFGIPKALLCLSSHDPAIKDGYFFLVKCLIEHLLILDWDPIQ